MSHLTGFAGLEVLDPADLLSTDDWRFQAVNPALADRLLQIGAVTHKHDAHAALADPAVASAVTTSPEGGTIPSDTSIGVVHTWVDTHGGETLPSPVAIVNTPEGLQAPQNPPTLTVDNAAGALLAGNYTYAITVADGAGGETTIGPSDTVVVDPGFPEAEVKITGLKAILEEVVPGIGAAEWRLWRQQEGGLWYLMAMGVVDEVVDDGTLVGDCTVEPPPRSTTAGTNSIEVIVPAAPGDAEFFRLYVSEDGAFTSPCFVAQYPLAEIGETIVIGALALLTGSPPRVSQSYPGANQIDPDTDILEMTWKRPVAKASVLPAEGNTDGDTRMALDTHHIWIWTGAAWADLTAKIFITTHDFVLRGPVSLEPPIPGHDIQLAAGQSQTLVGVRYKILSGTSLSFRLQKNGADIAGFGTAGAPLIAKEEAATTAPAGVALANNDEITPLLSLLTGEPTGGKISLIIAHLI
jgi:hypothetical protein